MPIDTREMRGKRASLIQNCRREVDRAVAENRAMTATERSVYDRDFKESEELKAKIEDAERRNDIEREELLLHSSQEDLLRGRARNGNGNGSGAGTVEMRKQDDDPFRYLGDDGREYRALAHNQSARSVLGNRDDNLSWAKVLRGKAIGDWTGAEAEERAYSKGLDVSGGFLLTDGMSADFIDLAKAKSVVSAAGARTVVIPAGVDHLRLARVETRPTAYWTAETASITESTGTFGRILLSPRVLAVYCEISLEEMRDATNSMALIQQTITDAIALGLDAACLNGGTGDFSTVAGLKTSVDVDDYAIGGPFVWDHFITSCGRLWGRDVEAKSVIYNPAMRTYIEKLKDGEARYDNGPQLWRDIPKFTSSQLAAPANNCFYVGDFSNTIIGIRSGIEIEVSGLAGDVFKKKMVAVRGLLRADFAVGRADDVVRLSGITGT